MFFFCAHDMGFGCRREKQRIPNSKNIIIIRTVRRRLGGRREQSETSECFHFDYDRSFFGIDTVFFPITRKDNNIWVEGGQTI